MTTISNIDKIKSAINVLKNNECSIVTSNIDKILNLTDFNNYHVKPQEILGQDLDLDNGNNLTNFKNDTITVLHNINSYIEKVEGTNKKNPQTSSIIPILSTIGTEITNKIDYIQQKLNDLSSITGNSDKTTTKDTEYNNEDVTDPNASSGSGDDGDKTTTKDTEYNNEDVTDPNASSGSGDDGGNGDNNNHTSYTNNGIINPTTTPTGENENTSGNPTYTDGATDPNITGNNGNSNGNADNNSTGQHGAIIIDPSAITGNGLPTSTGHKGKYILQGGNISTFDGNGNLNGQIKKGSYTVYEIKYDANGNAIAIRISPDGEPEKWIYLNSDAISKGYFVENGQKGTFVLQN